MKRIKIILGVIVALTIVFFATGLFFKETTYTTQITVNKPIDEVFSLFNNTSKIKNWIPDVQSIEAINEKPEKTGSTYKMVVKNNNGEEIALEEKVIAFVPNEKVTLRFKSPTMLKTDDYVFSFSDGNTTIQNNSRCIGGSYILSCLFPYFKGKLQSIDQEYLNNFKAFIEKN
ncbi:SRPBCC family protein [uncultured Tenacibaculum sp.]|uniref:SRPBCC family protein n=1 Tax=uncultured Tenacibaculum sp. TaxID=174713 RepID=UPI0026372B2D|nr:SRPBCC family protein [uncultured Tenacibaculum sp.]